jgi:hypothetical protein
VLFQEAWLLGAALKLDEATAHFGVCMHREQACCLMQGSCNAKMVLDREAIVHHLVSQHDIEAQVRRDLKGIGTETGCYHAVRINHNAVAGVTKNSTEL